MFIFLDYIVAVAYNFLNMFSLYTAAFAFTGAGFASLISGGDFDG